MDVHASSSGIVAISEGPCSDRRASHSADAMLQRRICRICRLLLKLSCTFYTLLQENNIFFELYKCGTEL